MQLHKMGATGVSDYDGNAIVLAGGQVLEGNDKLFRISSYGFGGHVVRFTDINVGDYVGDGERPDALHRVTETHFAESAEVKP